MEIQPQRYKISVVLQSLFFPLTYPEVISSLESRGYVMTLPSPLPAVTGGRVYIGGRLAMKEGCIVDIDPDRKLLGSESKVIGSTIRVFQDLLAMTKEDFGVDLGTELDYVELLSDLVVPTETSPMRSMQLLSEGLECIAEFGEALETSVSLYGLRLAPKGLSPVGKDWFDIRIEPRTITPEKAYYISVVYRKTNMEEVLRFAGGTDEMVLRLVKIIEEVGP